MRALATDECETVDDARSRAQRLALDALDSLRWAEATVEVLRSRRGGYRGHVILRTESEIENGQN